MKIYEVPLSGKLSLEASTEPNGAKVVFKLLGAGPVAIECDATQASVLLTMRSLQSPTSATAR